jgi:hypothetical protein
VYGHDNCPKCEQSITRFDLSKVIVGDQLIGPFFHGVSICCPNQKCKTVLGVSIDPAALAADIALRVANKIQGKTR